MRGAEGVPHRAGQARPHLRGHHRPVACPERARLRVKGRSGTKPGSILRRQIPIRTFAEWDERIPGFCEVDLVAHDGGDPAGEFAHTLNLTCVKTGWDEMRILPNKAQRWVEEAIEDIRRALPFALRGLDSDIQTRLCPPGAWIDRPAA